MLNLLAKIGLAAIGCYAMLVVGLFAIGIIMQVIIGIFGFISIFIASILAFFLEVFISLFGPIACALGLISFEELKRRTQD
jgi:hypothetical protein